MQNIVSVLCHNKYIILNNSFFDFDQYEIPVSQNTLNVKENAVLVAVIYEEDLVKHYALLHKILKAVGLDPEKHVNTIKLKEGEVIKVASLESREMKYVLGFGIKAPTLGINASLRGYRFYETETFSVLFSHSLESLSTSNERKKALWEALQAEFKSQITTK